jgi:phage-related protein
MPVHVVYYKEDSQTIPMVEWMEALSSQPKHRAKCNEWIGLLRDFGHELRRPEADYLRDGIYELRPRFQKIRYRMLYFFYERDTAVITHGLIKQVKEVPWREIQRALERKQKFGADPASHTFYWEPDDEC